MQNKLLLFLFFFLIFQSANSQNRECFCSQKYSLTTSSPIVGLGVDLAPFQADDQRDTCDFKCTRTCNENIRELIGGDKQIVTRLGMEKMCQDVAPDRSVIKDGIVLWSYSNLDLCLEDQQRLEDNICCANCQCKFVYYRAEEKIPPLIGGVEESLIIENDLSQNVFQTLNGAMRAFKCDQLEHDRVCETNCRAEIAAATKYKPLFERLDQNR